MKKFMFAELSKDNHGLYRFLPNNVLFVTPWPSDLPAPEPPFEWRDCARFDAQSMGLELKESDLESVRSYLEFRDRTDGVLGHCSLSNDIPFFRQPPVGTVVLVHSDGTPLLAFWEEDWTEDDIKEAKEQMLQLYQSKNQLLC